MGDWDFYCFLCAGTFIPDSIHDADEEEEAADDAEPTDFIKSIRHTPALTAWLSTFRVIGENPAAAGVRRCYLSGPAEAAEYGHAEVAKGNDPVAPGVTRDEKVSTGVYRNFDGEGETGALPVHDCCLRVLARCFLATRRRGSLAGGRGGVGDDEAEDFWFRLDDDGVDVDFEDDDDLEGEEDVQKAPKVSEERVRIDVDALFQCVSSKREEYRCSLDIDYGPMNGMAREQYFYMEKGREPYVLDPMNIEDMKAFTTTLPLLHTPSSSFNDPMTQDISPAADDPFGRLSLELLTMIYLNLPQETLPQAIAASRSLSRIRNFNWFWQQRIKMDMPWAWEVLEVKKEDLDYHQAYIKLATLVKDPLKSAIPALANRKRVWYACEQILELYQQYLLEYPPPEDEPDTASAAMRSGAKLERFAHVATSKLSSSKNVSTVWFPLSREYVESEKKLVLYWKDGSLAGLEISVVGTQTTRIGNTTDTDDSHNMLIGEDDWFSKIIFHILTSESKVGDAAHAIARSTSVVGITIELLHGGSTTLGSSGKGDVRLFMPQRDTAIVGLKVQMAGGIITRLGLLEHAYTGLNQTQEVADPALLTYLWADKLPAQHDLGFSECRVGYWGMRGHQDLVPFTCLMFGAEEQEDEHENGDEDDAGTEYLLSSITGISGSHNARSWKVHHRTVLANNNDDGLVQSAGLACDSSDMRFFPIEGSSGERVVRVSTDLGAYVAGVTITTNKGRQCHWGKTDNAKIDFIAPPGRYIAGVYCSHGYGAGEMQTSMTTFATITAPITTHQTTTSPSFSFDAMTDEQGLAWDPSPPNPDYVPTTTYYGTSAQGEIATFLDFSVPVERITGLLAASAATSVDRLGGFTIVYSNGATVFCGATTAASEIHNPCPAGSTVTGFSPEQRVQEQAELPHVESEEEARAQLADFNVDGERIVMVKVWAGAYLCGIQFVTQTGRESPRWGKCGGPASVVVQAGASVEIEADGGGGGVEVDGVERQMFEVVGIKIVLGSRRYHRGYAGVRPLAVQVMGVRRR